MIRFIHVVYAVALLASHASIYEWTGVLSGLIVLALWAIVFYRSNRPSTLGILVAITILGGCLIGLLLPAQQAFREAHPRSHCKNNLKQIEIALNAYHESYHSFPPAYIADENGIPMHSWRVLILPFLDHKDLYDQYDFEQPWDSPDNQKLSAQMPKVFRCPYHGSQPSDREESTNYVAVLGPRTAWPGTDSVRFRDMTDGSTNIINIVECHHPEIPWTAPQDFTLKEAVDSLASTDLETYGGHYREEFTSKHYYGRNVGFPSGDVDYAPFGLDRKLARELFTIDDGKPEPPFDLSTAGEAPPSIPKWGNQILVWIFFALNVLPLPWVWWNPSSGQKIESEPDSDTTQRVD